LARERFTSRRADLENEADDFNWDDATGTALLGNFIRAIALFDYALLSGSESSLKEAIHRLSEGTNAAAGLNFVTAWWVNKLAKHFVNDLWHQSLHVRLPTGDGNEAIGKRWNELREVFIAIVQARRGTFAEVELWPSQIAAAARVMDTSDDLVAVLPTSAGKTRIAELCILRTLSEEQRVAYLSPLRALSAQPSLPMRVRQLGRRSLL
jgi:hypothetical protein